MKWRLISAILAWLALLMGSCQQDEEVMPEPAAGGFTKTFLLGHDARPYYAQGMNTHHLIATIDNSLLVLFNDLPPGRPETENKIVLKKFSGSGETLWESRLSFPEPSFGNGLLELRQGGYLIIGFQSPLTIFSESEVLLIRAGPDGGQIWSNAITREGEEVGLFAAERPEGGFWVLGKKFGEGKSFLLTADSLGHELSRQEEIGGYPLVNVIDMRPTPDGGLILGGDQIIKIDASGQFEWEYIVVREYPELGIRQRCTSIVPSTLPFSGESYLGLGHRNWNIGTEEEAEGYFLFTLYPPGLQGSFNLIDLQDSDEPEMIIEGSSGGFIFTGISLDNDDLRKTITLHRMVFRLCSAFPLALILFSNKNDVA